MQPSGPRIPFSLKPASQSEATGAEAVAPVEVTPEPASEAKPAKSLPPIPKWILEGRYTESMDAPMRRGPGSKR